MQLKELTEVEKSWLAAIIEGEGCISLHRERKNDRTNVKTTIHITNTDIRMLQRASDYWYRLNMRFHYVLIWPKKHRKKYKPALCLKCNSTGSARKLLRSIYPYLASKKDQVDILLEYIDYRERLIKRRGPDGRYVEYMDQDYCDSLIETFKETKRNLPDLLHVSRKANIPLLRD